MSESEIPAYLMSLTSEQLEQIHDMLVKRIEEQKKKPKRSTLPPAFHDLDSLAANVGLDLTGLMRDIKRRS